MREYDIDLLLEEDLDMLRCILSEASDKRLFGGMTFGWSSDRRGYFVNIRDSDDESYLTEMLHEACERGMLADFKLVLRRQG